MGMAYSCDCWKRLIDLIEKQENRLMSVFLFFCRLYGKMIQSWGGEGVFFLG